jgi:WD40 repeat protein
MIVGRVGGSRSERIRCAFFSAAEGRPIGEPVEFEGWIRTAAISPNGRVAFVAVRRLIYNDAPKTVSIFLDVVTGKTIGEERALGDASAPRAVFAAFHPDGRVLAVSGLNGAQGVEFWDVATREPAGSLDTRTTHGRIAYSADGAVLAVAQGEDVRLWEVETAVPLGGPIRHPCEVVAMAFSPGGRILATATSPYKVEALWLWPIRFGLPLGDGEARIWTRSHLRGGEAIKQWAEVVTDTEFRRGSEEISTDVHRSQEWYHRFSELAAAESPAGGPKP